MLAGWPGYSNNAERRTDVAYARQSMDMASPVSVVSGERVGSPPVEVSLQPPLLALTDDACVVYGLGPG